MSNKDKPSERGSSRELPDRPSMTNVGNELSGKPQTCSAHLQ